MVLHMSSYLSFILPLWKKLILQPLYITLVLPWKILNRCPNLTLKSTVWPMLYSSLWFSRLHCITVIPYWTRSWWHLHMEKTSSITGHLWGASPVTSGVPSQRYGNSSFEVFWVISLKNLLNNQSSCEWFEMPWHSCDNTKMLASSIYD